MNAIKKSILRKSIQKNSDPQIDRLATTLFLDKLRPKDDQKKHQGLVKMTMIVFCMVVISIYPMIKRRSFSPMEYKKPDIIQINLDPKIKLKINLQNRTYYIDTLQASNK